MKEYKCVSVAADHGTLYGVDEMLTTLDYIFLIAVVISIITAFIFFKRLE